MYYASRILSMIALVGGALVTLAAGAHATTIGTEAPSSQTARIEQQPVQTPPAADASCPEAVGTDARQTATEKSAQETTKERKSERRSAASLTDAEREYWSSLDLIEK